MKPKEMVFLTAVLIAMGTLGTSSAGDGSALRTLSVPTTVGSSGEVTLASGLRGGIPPICQSDSVFHAASSLSDPCSDCLASCPPPLSPGHLTCVRQCNNGPCHA